MPRNNRRNNAVAAAGGGEPEHIPVLTHRHQELVNKHNRRLLADRYRRLPRDALTIEQMRFLADNPPYSVAHPHWAGLWRGSAEEATPHDAYPACLQVFPEMIDGAIGQGNATHIKIKFVRIDPRTGILTARDNGRGIQNWARLKQWAAPDSISNIHRNGHGLKKSMTKFAPEYETATFAISSKDGVGREVSKIESPFVGDATPTTHFDDIEFAPGTEIAVVFDWHHLGKYTKATDLLSGLKEIIRTRYSEEKLEACRFEVEVEDNTGIYRADSRSLENEWHSFEWHVRTYPGIRTIQEHATIELPTSGAPYTLAWYNLFNKRDNGLTAFGFPNYGKRNREGALVYVYLNGRLVEAMPFVGFSRDKGRNQDSFNGNIVIVNFTSDDHTLMPSPCTTKVSMNRNNPIFKEWFAEMQNILNQPLPIAPGPVRQRSVKKEDIVARLRVNFEYDGDVLMAYVGGNWVPLETLQLVPRT